MKNGVSSPPSVEAALLMAKTALRLRNSGPDTYTQALNLPRRFKCSPTVNVDRLNPYNSLAARHNPPDPEPAPGPAGLPVPPTTGAACPSRRRRAALGPQHHLVAHLEGRVDPARVQRRLGQPRVSVVLAAVGEGPQIVAQRPILG